ncbi:MAG: HAD-IB family hydrolase [Agarilytica sp.]
MSLAIFDLDNTLIGGDSDHSWGEFLCEKGIVDENSYKQQNDQFYEDYKAGHLDMQAYVAFALTPLKTLTPLQRNSLHEAFMKEKIQALWLPAAKALIDKHRALGHTLLIITATNRFITEPIAKWLNIPHLLATEPEIVDEQFTGNIIGAPCFQEGKVTRLNEWLASNKLNMKESFFYSDSINDLPLLEQVSYPHAVDPDEKLREHAEKLEWPILSLR